MYANAQYVADGGQNTGVRCLINDVQNIVPLDPRNTDYAAIMALVASGDLVIAEADAPPVAPPPALTARQIRLQLLSLGFDDAAVEAAIDELPAAVRAVARIEWRHATTFPRDHALIAPLGAALGLSAEHLDSAWVQASTL